MAGLVGEIVGKAKAVADLGYSVELLHVDVESNADTARTQAEKAWGGRL